MIKFFLISTLTIISSCATSYQPMGFSGGYADEQLNKNLYQVRFQGNGYTSSNYVREMFLRRCAELTIEKGFKSFVLISRDNDKSHSLMNNQNGSYVVTKSQASGMIKLSKDEEIGINAEMILKKYKK